MNPVAMFYGLEHSKPPNTHTHTDTTRAQKRLQKVMLFLWTSVFLAHSNPIVLVGEKLHDRSGVTNTEMA